MNLWTLSAVSSKKSPEIHLGIHETHSATRDRIKHPCRRHDHDAGLRLDVNHLPTHALLAVLPPNRATIEGVPGVMDYDGLPDMGTMTVRLRLAAETISSAARTKPRRALPSSTA